MPLASMPGNQSTVSIMRHFDDAQRDAHGGLIGVRGTHWLLSPTTIVTARARHHAMALSTKDWKLLEIVNEDGSQFIAERHPVPGPELSGLFLVAASGRDRPRRPPELHKAGRRPTPRTSDPA